MTKAQKTRQFIVEKTAAVFNSKGFAGTSLSDITKATGLTKGSIYGNFESKDEVALAAFDYNFSLVSSFVQGKMDRALHSADKLKVYLTVYSEFMQFPSLHAGCPVLNTAIEADDTHPALRAKAVNAITKWYRSIENTIKQGRLKGELKNDFDAKEFAGAFIAIIEGGIMLTKVTGKMSCLEAALKQAGKMIDAITE